MAYNQFVKEYIAKGFLKIQKPNMSTVEKFIKLIKDAIKKENPQRHFKF